MRLTRSRVRCSRRDFLTCRISERWRTTVSGTSNKVQLTFSWVELPANRSASQDSDADLMTHVGTSRSSILDWLTDSGLATLSGKTCPVSCHPAEDGTLVPSSGRWRSSGMGSPGECWTLSGAEWTATLVPSHSDGGVCSLSDVLEATGDVPPRFYLSPKASLGILRRAERRGKALPEALRLALETVTSRT